MEIGILIPVHNESKTIGNIVKSLKEINLDVFVIDDGSEDNSGSIAKENGAIVFLRKGKKGKGCSLREGFDYLSNKNYLGIITMDGDGQHDVSDIKKFISYAQKNSNIIITGNRMFNAKGMPFVRYLTNRIMSICISMVCKQKIPDTQCGYRYVGAEILKNISLDSNDFEIETEILIKASKKGYKIISIPIKTIYQDERSKIDPFKDTLRFLKYFIKEIFS